LSDNGGVSATEGDGGTPTRPEPWLLTDEELSRPLASPLFLDVATLSVDPAYVEAAARRAAGGARSGRAAGVALLACLAALGLLLATAARTTRSRATGVDRVRAELVAEARRRTTETDALVATQDRLRAETEAARDRQLGSTRSGRDLADRLGRLELAAAAVPVTGPGVVVRLEDSPEAGGPDDPNGDGRVRDRDIQEVVNALWAAGAEAVAVDGLRISALTAIREAGQAVLVDYRPITAPYRIEALGDPAAVEPAFAASPTAGRFRTFTEFYGLGFTLRRADELRLPGAETLVLRHARPVAP
jgi:uncharacterized protein YlxW (UPF0749 family)